MGQLGGGGLGEGSGRVRWLGGGGSKWGDLGGTCPQGPAFVNHRLPSYHTITLKPNPNVCSDLGQPCQPYWLD